jgi:hypothetical protein
LPILVGALGLRLAAETGGQELIAQGHAHRG